MLDKTGYTVDTFNTKGVLTMARYHATLTHRELQTKLRKRNTPIHKMEEALTDAKIARKHIAADRAFQRVHREAWRAILTPMRQEWNNANIGAKYDPNDKERVHAFEMYATVLERTRNVLFGMMHKQRKIQISFNEYAGNTSTMLPEELRDLRSAYAMNPAYKYRPFTPSELARHINERAEQKGSGFIVPNNGVHWVDWVHPTQKALVADLFLELSVRPERKKQAKVKQPFRRVDTNDKFDAKRERLLGTASREVERLTQLYEVAMKGRAARQAAFDETGIELKEDKKDVHLRLARRIEKAKRAVSILTTWTREDGALPNTWHGVLGGA